MDPGLSASSLKCFVKKVLSKHQSVSVVTSVCEFLVMKMLMAVSTQHLAPELDTPPGGGKDAPDRTTCSANTREAGVHSKSQYLYFSECRIQIFYNNL